MYDSSSCRGGSLAPAPHAPSKSRLIQAQVIDIEVAPNEARGSGSDIKELKASIQARGVIVPIIVVENGSGNKYRLAAGERRLRACRELGIARIPAIVCRTDERGRQEMQLIENLQRAEFSPFEVAERFCRLRDEFDIRQDQIAARIGKTPAYVSQVMSVLRIGAEERRRIEKLPPANTLPASVVVELVKAPPLLRLELLADAEKKPLTVAYTRHRLRAFRGPYAVNTTSFLAELTLPGVPARSATITIRFKSPCSRRPLVDIRKALRAARTVKDWRRKRGD